MWRRYYERWESMTIDELGPDMVDLVRSSPASSRPRALSTSMSIPLGPGASFTAASGAGIETVVITGGETDVCVLATVLGAIDWGFRVILVPTLLQLGRRDP